jgi:hypothetical protein
MYPMPSIVHWVKFSTILKLDRPELKYSHWQAPPPKEFDTSKKNIFNLIRKSDRLFHHPYENFSGATDTQIKVYKEENFKYLKTKYMNISAYGSPAKATTSLNYYNIRLKH